MNDPARGYAVSQRIQKRLKEAFGWIKTIAGQEKTSFRGVIASMGFYLRCHLLQSRAAAQADSGGRLMAKAPGFAKAFAGRRRIVEMENWDSDFLDGEIAFGALKGFPDSATTRETVRPARSSHGKDMTRMIAPAVADGRLRPFYIHNGDDSGFVCECG